jgi:hypothetical protein
LLGDGLEVVEDGRVRPAGLVCDHRPPRTPLEEDPGHEPMHDAVGLGRAGEIHGGGLADADEGAVDGPLVLAADQLAHPVGHVELAVQRPEPRVRDKPYPVRAADRQVLHGDVLALGGLPRSIQTSRWSAHCQTPQGATIVMVRVTGDLLRTTVGGLDCTLGRRAAPAEKAGGAVEAPALRWSSWTRSWRFPPELGAFGFGGRIGVLRNTL